MQRKLEITACEWWINTVEKGEAFLARAGFRRCMNPVEALRGPVFVFVQRQDPGAKWN